MGNAVTVPVAEWIGRRIVSYEEAGQSDSSFKDEAYPEGLEWRCECGFKCYDDGPVTCPLDGKQLHRVNRRIRWGPLPSQVRDVVVEYR
jgi:hypothetical protein